jgi:hypothetical protein
MDWHVLGVPGLALAGWTVLSLLAAVLWALFAAGARHKTRRLPKTRAGLRAWIAGAGTDHAEPARAVPASDDERRPAHRDSGPAQQQ